MFGLLPARGKIIVKQVYFRKLNISPTWDCFRNSWQLRHNGRDSVSNHQPHDCLLKGLFRHRSRKTSKLRFTGLCAGTSPVNSEFPAQMASNAENVAIWLRHHVALKVLDSEIIWGHGKYICCLKGAVTILFSTIFLVFDHLFLLRITFWWCISMTYYCIKSIADNNDSVSFIHNS